MTKDNLSGEDKSWEEFLKTLKHYDHCAKCGETLGDEDKFCSYCGAPREVGEYEPKKNIFAPLYGPPYSAKYTCPKCGENFVVKGRGLAETRYCPKCGQVCDCESKRDPY